VTAKFAVAAGFAAAAVLVSASLALGHAQLVSSNPPAGGTLTSTPATINATFSEVLTPDGSSLIVQDATGSTVATGTVSTQDDTSMSANVPHLPDGKYAVLWTAVTADDKAVERGTYTFTVGSAATSSALASPAASLSSGSDQPPGSGNNLLIALVLAALVVVGVLGYLFLRNRR
jgi:methionine-rich copper-binding protein CopC